MIGTKCVTINDDFTDKKTDVPYYAPKFHVVLIQEGKNTDYSMALNPNKFGVAQGKGPARSGSAVVWQYDKFQFKGTGQALLVRSNGVRMEDRWIRYVDLKRWGRTRRYASCHFPPRRYDHLWDEAVRSLNRFIDTSPFPVVIGMDANRYGGPQRLTHRALWKGSGVDGFVYSKSLRLWRLFALRRRQSDHNAVRVVVRGGPKD